MYKMAHYLMLFCMVVNNILSVATLRPAPGPRDYFVAAPAALLPQQAPQEDVSTPTAEATPNPLSEATVTAAPTDPQPTGEPTATLPPAGDIPTETSPPAVTETATLEAPTPQVTADSSPSPPLPTPDGSPSPAPDASLTPSSSPSPTASPAIAGSPTASATPSPPPSSTPTQTQTPLPSAVLITITAELAWYYADTGAVLDWVAEEADAPTVWFQLWRSAGAGGEAQPAGDAPLKELVTGTLKVSWADMPDRDGSGEVYIYSVRQVDAEGLPYTPDNFTAVEDGLTVTNTFHEPEIIDPDPDNLGSPQEISAAPSMVEPVNWEAVSLGAMRVSGPQTAVDMTTLLPGDVVGDKTIAPVEGLVNTWDITLSVVAKDLIRTSDTVLIIDTSGSMAGTRLSSAKNAANLFVDALLADGNTTNQVALVSFASSTTTYNRTDPFIDTSGRAGLKSAINNLVAVGGTFTQAAMHQAELLLASSTADMKNIVILSDGEPTYCYAINSPWKDTTSNLIKYYSGTSDLGWQTPATVPHEQFNYNSVVGTGTSAYSRYYNVGGTTNDRWYNCGNSAIAEANYSKSLGYTVYSVALEAGDNGTSVLNQMASDGKAYTGSAADLDSIFNGIAGEIVAAARFVFVTDPMGAGFTVLGDVSGLNPSQGTATYDPVTKQLSWDAGTLTTVCPGQSDPTIKCATLTFRIILDDSVLATASTDGTYETNGEALFSYVGQDGTTVSVEYPVPTSNPAVFYIEKLLYDTMGNLVTTDEIPTRYFSILIESDNLADPNFPAVYDFAANQGHVLNNMLVGDTYTVTEIGVGGYPGASLSDYVATGSGQSFTVLDNTADGSITLTNDELPLGSLTIEKRYFDYDGNEIIGDWFYFDITCPDFEFGECPVYFDQPVIVPSGAANAVTFTDLPYLRYQVTEWEEFGLASYAVPELGIIKLSAAAKDGKVTWYNNENSEMGAGRFHKIWDGGPNDPYPNTCFRAMVRDYVEPPGTPLPWNPTSYIYMLDYSQTPYNTGDPTDPHWHLDWPQVPISHLADPSDPWSPIVYYEYMVEEGTCEPDGVGGFTNFVPFPDNAPAGYFSTQTNEQTAMDEWGTPFIYDVTMTNHYILTYDASFTATKVWVNGPAKPTIYFQLYRQSSGMTVPEEHLTPVALNGIADIDEGLPCDTALGCEVSAWQVQWTGLADTDYYGDPYTYSFREGPQNAPFTAQPIPMYAQAYSSDGSTVTNTYTPQLWDQIRAIKTWYQTPNPAGMAYQVMRSWTDETGEHSEVADTVYLPPGSTSWDYTWTNMPRTNPFGYPFTYRVREGTLSDPLDVATFSEGFHNYMASSFCEEHLRPQYPVNEVYCTFVNRELFWMTQSKSWVGGSEPRPETSFQLYAVRPDLPGDEPFAISPDAEGFLVMDGIADDPCSPAGCEVAPWVIGGWVPLTGPDGYVFQYSVQEGYWDNTDPANPVFVEAAPPGYTLGEASCVDGSNPVTGANELNCSTVNIAQVPLQAQKIWVDGPATHPAIAVQLYRQASGSSVVEAVLDPVMLDGSTADACPGAPQGCETSNWLASWENLDSADAAGNLYTFTVVEGTWDGTSFTAGAPANYQVDYGTLPDGAAPDGTLPDGTLTVTNTFTSPRPDITATKTWVNGATADHVAVNLAVYQDGVPVPSSAYTISHTPTTGTSDTFTYTISGLPQYRSDGTTFVYTVREVDAAGNLYTPPNYVKSEAGLAVTNTYQSPRPDITATKTWENGPVADHVAVNLAVYQGTALVPSSAYSITVNPPAGTSSSFSYTISGLPQYQEDGVTAFVYSVREVDASGADYTPANYIKTESGLTVTNTYQSPTLDLIATKTWVDGALADHVAVDLAVFQDGEQVPSSAYTISHTPASGTSSTFTYTISGLPQYRDDGTSFVYTVQEVDAAGNLYTPPHYVKSESGLTVTNTYQSPRPDITATVTWVNGAPADHVAVNLAVYQGTALVPAADYTIAVSPATGTSEVFTYTISGLPQYQSDGETAYVYSVREVDASGADYTPTNYVKSESGLAITNTFTSPTPDITATKTWVNGALADHVAVDLAVYQDGVQVPSSAYTISHSPATGTSSTFTYTLSGLPQYRSDGTTFVYTVHEVDAAGNLYTPPNYVKSEAGLTVTNTYQSPRPDITATVTWVNGAPADHVVVNLAVYQGTALVPAADYTLMVNPATGTSDVFTYTISGLPQYEDDGVTAYVYAVREVDASGVDYTPLNYVKTESGLNITNTFTSPRSDITASKTWVNGATADHVAVDLAVYQDGVQVPSSAYTISHSPATGTSSTFTYTISGLPQYRDDGSTYVYTVHEVDAAGNLYTPPNYVKSETGLTITNTYQSPRPDITATKTWVNGPVADHVAVNLAVYQGTTLVPSSAYSISVSPATGTSDVFTYTISGLPQYEDDGVTTYVYSVREVDASGADYTPANYVKTESGLNLTNTFTSPRPDITATKTWVNGATADHVAVDLAVYANGTLVPAADYTITHSPASGTSSTFTYTISGLPQYDLGGEVITYTVREVDGSGNLYTPANYTKTESGLTITNTYVSPRPDITATKTWVNGPVADHVAVNLAVYQGTTLVPASDYTIAVSPATGTSGVFTYTISGLPQYEDDGVTAYVYSVREVDASGADYTPANYVKTESGLTVTNTFTSPRPDITATVTWVNGAPGDHVAVNLAVYQGTALVPASDYTIAVSPATGTSEVFTYTISGLPQYQDDGVTAYVYSVREVDASGADYTPTNYVKTESGLTITNTFTSPRPDLTATKTWVNGATADHVAVNLAVYQDGVQVPPSGYTISHTPATGTNDVFTYTISGLPQYRNDGTSYVYTVHEVDAAGNLYTPPNYVKTETGLAVTNTFQSPRPDITATKTWVNGPVADHVAVNLAVYQGTTRLDPADYTITVSPATGTSAVFTYTISGLPQYQSDGVTAYAYSVREVDASGADYTPANYTKTESGLTITNTFVSPTPDITATKTWVNGDTTYHLAVNLIVYQDGVPVPSSSYTISHTPATGTNATFAYTISGLPSLRPDGSAYIYSVREVDGSGNLYTPLDYVKDESGLSVTNTYISPLTEVTVNLIWVNGLISDHVLTDIAIYQDGNLVDPAAYTVETSPPSGTSSEYIYKISGLPEYHLDGVTRFVYTASQVDASGADYTPTNYVKSESGLTITNTFTSPRPDITATKTWVNGATADHVAVNLAVYANGTLVPAAEYTITHSPATGTSSVFTYTLSNLPQYNLDGEEITYTVAEVDAAGNLYTPPNYEKNEAGLSVTNTYRSPRPDLTATATWVNGAPADHVAVNLAVYRGTALVPSSDYIITVSPATGTSAVFTYTISGLPQYQIDGVTAYVYSVREVDASGADYTPTNYVKSESGLAITNTFVSPRPDITATKTWVNGATADHVAVDLAVYQDGAPVPSSGYTISHTPATGTSDVFTYTISGLPQYRDDGSTYAYTVHEVDAAGNLYTPPNYVKSEAGLTVTNTYQSPRPALTASVTWVNGAPGDHVAVNLAVYQGTTRVPASDYSITVSPATGTSEVFTYTIGGLPQYEEDGVTAYVYSVREVDASGADYTPANYVKTESGLTITNIFTSPRPDISATKTWVNGATADHVAVDLAVYQDGAPVPSSAYTISHTPATGNSEVFTYTIAGLPQYRNDGTTYVYTVREVDASGNLYTPVNYTKTESGLTITNSYVSPTPALSATVTWVNGPVADHVAVNLAVYQGTELVPSSAYSISVSPATGTSDVFTYTISGLPQYQDDGVTAYVYSVREVDASGTDYTPTNYTKTESGLTITNTFTSPRPDITATKTWVNGATADHVAVDLAVYQDGVQVPSSSYGISHTPATGTSSTFTYTITGLPQYRDDGSTYVYTVHEVDASGNLYTPPNYVKSEAGLTVTNTYQSPRPALTATVTWVNGAPGDHVAVNLAVYQGTALVPSSAYSISVSPATGTSEVFTYTISGLPQYEEDGVTAYVYSVREVDASGADYTPTNYVKTESGLTITNTFTSPRPDITATKTWVNGATADHVAVDLAVYRGGVPVPSSAYTISHTPATGTSDTFTYTISGLPQYRDDGSTYVYTVHEVDAAGNLYTPPNYVKSEAGLTVTNTYQSPRPALTATVSWVNGAPGDHVAVNLAVYQGTALVPSSAYAITVSPPAGTSDVFTYTISGLPQYEEDGVTAYVYSVREVDASGADYTPTNYVKTESGLTITNTFTSPRPDITATKTWVNGATVDHVAVDLAVYQDGVQVPPSGYTISHTPATGTSDTFTYTISGLPQYRDDGTTYVYTVREVDAAGNLYTPPNYVKSESGLTVTNSYASPRPDITATVTWVNGPVADHVAVNLAVYQGTALLDPADYTITVSPATGTSNRFTYTISGLPQYQSDGVTAYVYSVREVDASGADYTPANYTKTESGLTITNTFTSPRPDITATKTWVNGASSDHVAVNLAVYQDGAPLPATAYTITHSPATGTNNVFTYTLSGLPQYRADGTTFVYTVHEVDAAGNLYTPPNYVKSESGLTVTNSYISPRPDITATVTWENGPHADHVAVALAVYQGTALVPSSAYSITVSPATGTSSVFTYTISGLPRYQSDGVTAYVYSVREVDASGNDYTPPNYTKNESGLTITNSFVSPRPDITATKTWVNGAAADHVAVNLAVYQDGVQVPSSGYTISHTPATGTSDVFTYTISGLPQYREDGSSYVYTVHEVDAAGNLYTPPNYIKTENGLAVTNSYVSPRPDFTATKTWVNGPLADHAVVRLALYQDDNLVPESAYTLTHAAVIAPTSVITYTFHGLPQYHLDGITPYVYRVEEIDASGASYTPPNYIKTENGLTVTNTYVSPRPDFTAVKTWVGGLASDHVAVELALYQNTVRLPETDYTITVNPPTGTSDVFTYTISGLPRFREDGTTLYEYTVREVDGTGAIFTPQNYQKTENGLSVVNAYVSPTQPVTATVNWVDGLLADHVPTRLAVYQGTTLVSPTRYSISYAPATGPADTFTYTINGLPIFQNDGQTRYTYSIRQVDATGAAYTPVNYRTDTAGLTVTNTYVSPTPPLTATKTWVNGAAADHVAVNLAVYQDTALVPPSAYSITVSPSTGTSTVFTYTINGLPQFQRDGATAYGYSVREVDAAGDPYTPGNYTKTENGLAVTNRYVSPTQPVTATVNWINGRPADHVAVDLAVYQGAQLVNPALYTISYSPATGTSDTFTYIITGLPRFQDDGVTPWVYTVRQVDGAGNAYTPPNYLTTTSALTVTNTYRSPTPTLTAQKIWVGGQVTDHVAVQLAVFQNTTRVDPSLYTLTVSPATGTSGTFTYTIQGLPQFGNDGATPYTYTVREVDAAGLDYTPPYYVKEEVGLTVTNRYTPPATGQVHATIEWVGGPEPRPDVWLTLYRLPENCPLPEFVTLQAATPACTPELVPNSSIPILEDGTLDFTWNGIVMNDGGGNPYQFLVQLTDAQGNPLSLPNYTIHVQGLKITNTYLAPMNATVTARKVWVGGDSARSLIGLRLYRQTSLVPLQLVPGAAIRQLPVGTTEVSWTGLQGTDQAGNPFIFSVREGTWNADLSLFSEGPPPGFSNTYSTQNGVLTVTNTFQAARRDVTATKIWVGGSTPRPTVYFQLRRQVSGGALEIVADIRALEDGTNSVVWSNLETADAQGNPYVYSVREVDSAGSSSVPSGYEKSESGLIVTNTYHQVTGTYSPIPYTGDRSAALPLGLATASSAALSLGLFLRSRRREGD